MGLLSLTQGTINVSSDGEREREREKERERERERERENYLRMFIMTYLPVVYSKKDHAVQHSV